MWQRVTGILPRKRWHYSWITLLLVTALVLLADFLYIQLWQGVSGWSPGQDLIVQAVGVAAVVTIFLLVVIGNERARMNRHLHDVETTDPVTGLRNRRGFFDLAEQQLLLARRRGEPLYLYYADIDDFKVTNELFGHREGDRVLQEMARTLKACYRESDIIARVGGDEFLVMPVGLTPEGSDLIIDRFNRAFERVQWHGKVHTASVSFGVAVLEPDSEKTLDELISEATTNMREGGPQAADSSAPAEPGSEGPDSPRFRMAG